MPAITVYVPDAVLKALELESARSNHSNPVVGTTPTKVAARMISAGLCEGDTLGGAVLSALREHGSVAQTTRLIAETVGCTEAEILPALDMLSKLDRVKRVHVAGKTPQGAIGWMLAA